MTLNLGLCGLDGHLLRVLCRGGDRSNPGEAFPSLPLLGGEIVATTTVGTTMADFADRSLGIGYVGGSLLLLALVLTVLVIWWRTEGSISVQNIREPRVEAFYWATILASNTLGTALGDFVAGSSGLGYRKGALVFAAALVVVALLYLFRVASTSILFWAAFILTRPLGATLGDFLTKPLATGGLNLGRFSSSAALLALMVVLIVLNNRSRGPAMGTRAKA